VKRAIITAVVTIFILLIAACIFFKIDTVNVEGNVYYSAEQIENLIFAEKRDRYTVVQLVKNILDKKEDIPFVDDYEIEFISPTEVNVLIYEKSIVAYVSYMSSYMYFDKDGTVIESASEKLEGIPEVTGLKFGSIVLLRKLPVEDERVFEDILSLTQELTKRSVKTNEIDYSNEKNIKLYLADYDIAVMLGDSMDMNLKIVELADILPELTGMSGTLYLDTYDKNDTDPSYTFKQKNP